MRMVSIEQLAVQRGSRLLFSNVSCVLEQGSIIHVLGENGCGKTSFYKAVLGHIPCHHGNICYDDTCSRSDDVLYIGHEASVKSSLTVAENMHFNAQLFDNYCANDDDIKNVARILSLNAFLSVRAGKLSAGQKRRVLLARLWLSDKRIWLLDEPLTALDSSSVACVLARIDDFVATGGAVMVTSHQPMALTTPLIPLKLSRDEGA